MKTTTTNGKYAQAVNPFAVSQFYVDSMRAKLVFMRERGCTSPFMYGVILLLLSSGRKKKYELTNEQNKHLKRKTNK